MQLWNAGSQHACATATTPMEIHSSCRCAVTQYQCGAALLKAKCNPHCSVPLCKTGSQQAVFDCSYTYGDQLFIQVCSDPAQMHCSIVQSKMQFPLLSAALQSRLTAGSVSLQSHLWSFALHTGVQRLCTNAPQLSTGQKCNPTVWCCSVKQAHSKKCVIAATPIDLLFVPLALHTGVQ